MQRIAASDLTDDWRDLLAEARLARERAYAPYSGFRVGAAVRTADGHVYRGCNVENAAYGLTVCAERVALFCAVADGQRDFAALALLAQSSAEGEGAASTPCGSCRQVISELAPRLPILIADVDGGLWMTSADALLPFSFSAQDLGR